MFWLSVSCAVLALIAASALIKNAMLRKAIDELRMELSGRLAQDTNALISVSSNDRRIKRFAADLNVQLRLLRKERHRFQRGDREVKEAITNISHDLRTPLTAICGYLELLKKEEKSPDAKRYLSLIENSAQALKQLTEELFRYSVVASTAENLIFEDVVLNGILEESVAAHYLALKGRGIAPTIHMPERRIVRKLNRAALSRVFDNILSNALKYSDGDLDISLSDAGEIVFSNAASGLDEVQVGKLFNRFYTVEAARNAMGLGLTISKTLIEQMKGTIEARYGDRRLRIYIRFPDDPLDQPAANRGAC